MFLGAFAKLRKVTISFVVSVRLSLRMKQHSSHWTGIHEIWYLNIFRKYVEKIQPPLNVIRITDTLHADILPVILESAPHSLKC